MYLLFSIQRWLALILDMVVAGLAVVLVAVVVTWRESFHSGAVGLSLVMVMTFNKTLMSVVRHWTALEMSVGAVGRIKGFVEGTETEGRGMLGGSIPENWPAFGAVEFLNVVASHA